MPADFQAGSSSRRPAFRYGGLPSPSGMQAPIACMPYGCRRWCYSVGIRTLLSTWMTPLDASMSAFATSSCAIDTLAPLTVMA